MKRIPWKLVLWLIGLGPLMGLGGLVLLARLGDLPETEALANPKTDFATRVYSMDGKVLGSYYTENRSDARYESLPSHLVDALVSTEDARFYDHSGIDFIGLARSVYRLNDERAKIKRLINEASGSQLIEEKSY